MHRSGANPRTRCVAAFFASLITLHSAFAADVENCNTDAMLVFDASGSMAEIGQNQLSTSRITEARSAIREALPEITPYRRVGLLVYGPGSGGPCENIALRLAPTWDAAYQIITEIEAIAPHGGTPLTQAVEDAAQVLKATGPSGVVVLVTDGAETCGGQTCQAAATLAQSDITVHVIGFRLPFGTLVFSDHTGTVEEGAFNPDQRERLNTEARCLADLTGGEFATADSDDELVAALQEVLTCPIIGRLSPDAIHHLPT